MSTVDCPNAQDLFDGVLPALPPTQGPIVVTCVYNEELRLPDFLRHYKNMGVERFLIVNNASTDRTAEILRADAAVTTLQTSDSFLTNRAAWLNAIGNHYLIGKWALFPDADELLVFDGWPHRSIGELITAMEAAGEGGLFASMVDMYSPEPMGELTYTPDKSLIDTLCMFDSTGYYLLRNTHQADTYPAPTHLLYGGSRNRVWQAPSSQPKRRSIVDKLLNPHSGLRPGKTHDVAVKLLGYWLRRELPHQRVVTSKLPLLRWQKGFSFPRSPHLINHPIRLSKEWGALLHFKYLQDFPDAVRRNIARAQHARGGYYYTIFLDRLAHYTSTSMLYSGSKRFDSVNDLIDAGLVRPRS